MSAQLPGKVSINQLVFKSLYYRYKAFVTPLLVILVCFLIFWFIVMSQIQGYFAMRDELTVDQQNLEVMHRNLAAIATLNDAKLDSTLTLVTSALPTDKDFAGILSSLQNAAAFAGTTLGDYAFQLGDLSGLDVQGKSTAQVPVQLNVVLKGDVLSARAFVHQLKNQLPLSDVTAVSINANSTVTVTVNFYYASLPKIVFKDSSPLPVLGSAEQKLLDSLAVSGNFDDIPLASPSAQVTTVTPTPTVVVSPTIVTPTATASAQ